MPTNYRSFFLALRRSYMKAFIPASEKRVDEYSRTQRSSEDGTERVNTPRLAAQSSEASIHTPWLATGFLISSTGQKF